MLNQGRGGKKRKKRDDTKPSPRLPEALYYYLFMLVETAVVLGIWGAMRRDPREVLDGPGLDAPLGEQLAYNVASAWNGLIDVLTHQWWIPLGIALACAAVFAPRTPRARKRMATLISTIVVAVFFLLIALQFSQDMTSAARYTSF
jgi:hypothetical protein